MELLCNVAEILQQLAAYPRSIADLRVRVMA
jgi:hypothetical protein